MYTDAKFIKSFGLLLKAAARKKVYAQKALQQGREDAGHLLRVISESESVQAKRLFNSLRGQIDISEEYMATIFEEEIAATIEEYTKSITAAEQSGNTALVQALSQLRASEKRILSFYSTETRDIKAVVDEKYFVCKFCGYISTSQAPDKCPICGASKDGFKEINEYKGKKC